MAKTFTSISVFLSAVVFFFNATDTYGQAVPVSTDSTFINKSMEHAGRISKVFQWKRKKTIFTFFYTESLVRTFPEERDSLLTAYEYSDTWPRQLMDPIYGRNDKFYAKKKFLRFYLYATQHGTTHRVFTIEDTLSDYDYLPVPDFELCDSSLVMTDLNKNGFPEMWFVYRTHKHSNYAGGYHHLLPSTWKQWQYHLVSAEGGALRTYSFMAKLFISGTERQQRETKFTSSPYYYTASAMKWHFDQFYSESQSWNQLPLTYRELWGTGFFDKANNILSKTAK